MIGFLCATSAILAYQASFSQSVDCFKWAYIFGLMAFSNSCFHIFSILLPKVLLMRLRPSLDRGHIQKIFIEYSEEAEELSRKIDNDSLATTVKNLDL